MRVLVVYVHPKAQCFNRSVLDLTVKELTASGHEVQVADLYKEGFQPAMLAEDYAQFEGKAMPADVLREQDRVEWSDALVFIFPYWWWSIPALLKGWFDRVFSMGWAWLDPSKPELSPLKPRKVLVLTSAGASKDQLAKRGYDSAFDTQLRVGVFGYCNFSDITIKFLYDVYEGTAEGIPEQRLDEARESVRRFAS